MKLVHAKISDWKNIRQGVLDVEKASFEKSLRYTEQDDDFESFEKPHTINILALDGKKIIAYLMSCPLEYDSRYKKDSHYGKKDTFHLESIAVLPEYRGSGIGKKMIEMFIQDVKIHGYKRIVMDATSRKMVHIALKYGFKKIKYYPKWQGNRSSWFMERIF
jgi:ribosomal protein S18 acetylase RimI-like enzyme